MDDQEQNNNSSLSLLILTSGIIFFCAVTLCAMWTCDRYCGDEEIALAIHKRKPTEEEDG